MRSLLQNPIQIAPTALKYKKARSINNYDEIFLESVLQTIHANIANENFDVPQLARKVFVSVSQLNRRLNNITNCPAGNLIRDIRLQHAANLLVNSSFSIGQIAFEVGYKNQANFCRSFKQYFGCSPSSYTKSTAKHSKINL